MDYFDNKFFGVGLVLIFLSAGITMLLGRNFKFQIVGAIVALIGFVIMMFGVYQINAKTKSK